MPAFANKIGRQLINNLDFPGNKVSYISWSPNGLVLAIGLSNGNLHFWDNISLSLNSKFAQHNSQIEYIIWSNDGNFIACLTAEQKIYIRDFATLSLVQIITPDAKKILTISWSSDNQFVNAALIFGLRPHERLHLQSHNIKTGHKLNQYSEEIWSKRAFPATSQNGKLLSLGLIDGSIQVWDISDIKLLISVKESHRKIYSVELSHDKKILALAIEDGSIQLWELNLKSRLAGLYKHQQPVNSLSFSCDGRILASKSLDHTIRLWLCDTWEVIDIIEEKSCEDVALAFHPTLYRLVTFDKNNTALRIWDIDPNILLESLKISDPIYSLFDRLEKILSVITIMSNQPKYNLPNVTHLKIFEEFSGTYNENNYATDHYIKQALDDLKQLIGDLQQKHPQATEEEAANIIDAEFKEIQLTQHQRWRNFLKLKRLWNGVKKSSLKVGEHFAEETPWGKAVIGFFEGVTDDTE